MRFTKALRKSIVEEYAARHGGQFDAAGFLAEVEKKGAAHPAHSWFNWDDVRAAQEHRLGQARAFVSDLRVSFKIEALGRDSRIVVRQTFAPMAISPLQGRADGGGYTIFDPSNPAHQSNLCREASAGLEAWLRRYEGALAFASVETGKLSAVIDALQAVGQNVPADDGKADIAARQ